jgi:hypothetical protein
MRLEISALVREAGATTACITHDQAEAFALADRAGVLERGRLVQRGTPGEIYPQPATPFVARFTGLTGEHHLTGTVADVALRGRGNEQAIDIPGHGRLTSVFSDTRAARGEHVGLRLDPRGCHLLSARARGDACTRPGQPAAGAGQALAVASGAFSVAATTPDAPDHERRVIVPPGQGLASEP